MIENGLTLCSMVWYGFPMPQDGFPMVILRTVVNLQRYLVILLLVLLLLLFLLLLLSFYIHSDHAVQNIIVH